LHSGQAGTGVSSWGWELVGAYRQIGNRARGVRGFPPVLGRQSACGDCLCGVFTAFQNGVTVNNQIASKIESSVLLLESAAAVGFSQNQVFEDNLSNGAFWRNQAICLFDSDPCTNDPYLYNIYPEFQAPSKYIVVKFKIANKFHYGWIELDSYCSGGLMAYNSEPGLRLRVGMID